MKTLSLKRSVMIAVVAATLGSMPMSAGAATSFRVTVPGSAGFEFRSAPRWVTVPGTRVYRVRDDMRPNEDFFRYGNFYYVYSGGNWYRANRWNGRYVLIQERNVPMQFYDVPQSNWRAYPTGWQNRPRRRY